MSSNQSTAVPAPDNPDADQPPNDQVQGGASVPPAPTGSEPDSGPKVIPSPYFPRDGHIYWNNKGRNPPRKVPLANFVAMIVTEIDEDDGISRRKFYEVAAKFRRLVYSIRVAASDFESLDWVHEHLGAEAVIFTENGARRRLPNAIRLFSSNPEQQVVYSHLGWRRLPDERWVYLHAGGALGADGPVDDVRIKVPDALSRFNLPSPPAAERLGIAVRASLRFLSLAPDAVTVPLYAAPFLAVLGQANFTMFAFGPSGEKKTSLAVLLQQHFGRGLDIENLTLNFESTANFIEETLFVAKDALCIVDDFAPKGSQYDAQRQQGVADRILRAQGNQSGRGRMTRNCEIRPPRPPRGLVLATGEDVPRGASLRARTFLVEVPAGCVDLEKLTACQDDAADGLFAEVTAAFIQWIAPQYEMLRKERAQRTQAFRLLLRPEGAHARTTTNASQILAALEIFFDFAWGTGALSEAEKENLWSRAWNIIQQGLRDQSEHQETSDPGLRFVSLIASGLNSGLCHLLPIIKDDGSQRPWERGSSISSSFPRGKMIGWSKGPDVFLDPEASWTMAQQIARDQNEPFTVSAFAVRRMLRDKGLLTSTDKRGGKEHLTIRIQCGGVRHEVLHLSRNSFSPPDDSLDVKQCPSAPLPAVLSDDNEYDLPDDESTPEDEGADDIPGEFPDKPDDEEDLDDGAPVPPDDGSDDLHPAADEETEPGQ